ncbi:hypothetical protein BDV34DRAFT_105883 [Aspergillus parasiticus]|uniref:Uncharacterized protein n=1 Tax=Aspergillus parasiticus TaxID=5067 RepID=A0A5N6DKK8_ASPPA|nr:hypothetical protein BDV34DRAFT_105883 [Aspergillus parasiticus]
MAQIKPGRICLTCYRSHRTRYTLDSSYGELLRLGSVCLYPVRAKVLALFPSIEAHAVVKALQRSITDIELCGQCLSGANTIISENIVGLPCCKMHRTLKVSNLQVVG